MDYERIDVDCHAQENYDCWTSRLSAAKWGDRIPHLQDKPDGTQEFVIGGVARPLGMTLQCHAAMPDRETLPTRWEQVPKSVYVPSERLKAMEIDGIDVEVLYPNTAGASGQGFQGMEPDLEAACIRAYNDMLIDEWAAASPRFVPLCMLPYSEMGRAVEELVYAVKRGHKGPIVFSTPQERGLPHFNDHFWEPLWATAQDLGVPIHFHGLGGTNKARWETMPGTSYRRTRALSGGAGYGLQAQCFANLLFSGVLDRFPKLTFVCAESGLGWVPYVLEMCDYEWEQCKLYKHGYPTRPSELFRRQIYVDFWYEKASLQLREVIGVDRIMWESDYPHPTSLWPHSSRWIDWCLEDVPPHERRQILVDNAKQVYAL